jgi:hypothetical protein
MNAAVTIFFGLKKTRQRKARRGGAGRAQVFDLADL